MSNEIKKVIPVSLKRRRPEKGWAVIGGLIAQDFPLEMIDVHDAMDGYDFDDVYEVCDAAVADGFPGFGTLKQQWLEKTDFTDLETTTGHFCCAWSYLQAWRKIAEGDGHCVFMADKFVFRRSYYVLQVIIDRIPDLHIFQIAHNDVVPGYDRVPWYPGEEAVPETGIMKGLAGCGEGVMVFSPKGAQQAIDYWNERPHWISTEALMWDISREGPHDGFYSAIEGLETGSWVNYALLLEHFTGKTDTERIIVHREPKREVNYPVHNPHNHLHGVESKNI